MKRAKKRSRQEERTKVKGNADSRKIERGMVMVMVR
jgi:hypothetical protein